MNHYFFANIRINNQDEYQKYLDKVDEVFEKYQEILKHRFVSSDSDAILVKGLE